jgi:tyrosine-protein phosphatase SIW14
MPKYGDSLPAIEETNGVDVPHLSEVEPGVWRGGEPTAAGWSYLKSIGITDDLKLNECSEDEDLGATKNGIWLHYEPISLWDQTFGAPIKSRVDRAVGDIHPGTYIHCEHGQDRTGLIVGLYRVRVEGWSKKTAYKEMLAHGFHPALLGLSNAWKNQ